MPVDEVVFFRLKLPSPAVEPEVEQFRLSVTGERDESVVSSPSVVRVNLHNPEVFVSLFAQFPFLELIFYDSPHLVGMRSDNDEFFSFCYFHCHLDVCLCDVVESVFPVGVGMRPCQLHRLLSFPFGWQS